jgi:UDP-N-acetylmuramoyl-tripeptide--D-alanyl-D-alanine ligase
MDPITFYFVLLFLLPGYIVFIGNIIWDIYFWQTKDYRFDRMASHLRYDYEQSHRAQWSVLVKILAFLALTSFIWWPTNTLLGIIVFVVYALFTLEAFKFIESLINNPDIHNYLSLRSTVSIVVSVTLGLMLLLAIGVPMLLSERGVIEGYQELLGGTAINDTPTFFAFLVVSTLVAITLDLGTPLIATIAAIITTPFSWLRKYWVLQTARTILRSKPGLKVIGITGSVGKTTAADILYQLIEGNFKVVHAPTSYSTNLNIANSLFRDVRPDTDVLIAELGSYKRGEISTITKFIPLDIAIITNIEYSHIGLHRDQHSIYLAKREAIDGLKPNGVAILNAEDEYCQKIAQQNKGNEILFFTGQQPTINSVQPLLLNTVQAQNLKVREGKLEFDLAIGEQQVHIRSSIRHRHLIHSLLAAISAAASLGIDIDTIAMRVSHLRINEHDFSPINGTNNAKLIDATKTVSYSMLVEAIKELKSEDGNRRALLTKGIPELGKHKQTLYQKLAAHLHGIDVLFTSDSKLAKAVRSKNKAIEIVQRRGNDELIYAYRTKIEPQDIVLLAGPLPAAIMNALISTK